MNDGKPIMNWPLVAAMAFAGLAPGLANFAAVRRSFTLFGAGRGWLWPTLLNLGRIAAAALALVFTARLGAAAFLATCLGFLAARALALRPVRRAS
jgi:hypothetical protein